MGLRRRFVQTLEENIASAMMRVSARDSFAAQHEAKPRGTNRPAADSRLCQKRNAAASFRSARVLCGCGLLHRNIARDIFASDCARMAGLVLRGRDVRSVLFPAARAGGILRGISGAGGGRRVTDATRNAATRAAA